MGVAGRWRAPRAPVRAALTSGLRAASRGKSRGTGPFHARACDRASARKRTLRAQLPGTARRGGGPGRPPLGPRTNECECVSAPLPGRQAAAARRNGPRRTSADGEQRQERAQSPDPSAGGSGRAAGRGSHRGPGLWGADVLGARRGPWWRKCRVAARLRPGRPWGRRWKRTWPRRGDLGAARLRGARGLGGREAWRGPGRRGGRERLPASCS